jgi:Transglutaminase-like superfamily
VKPRTVRRKLAVEAFVAITVARLAVQFVSAPRLLAWAAKPPARPWRFADPGLPALVAATIDRIGAKLDAVCLPRALAAQAMLRRRGIASRLCLGVARADRSLSAHAWVEIGGKVIVGDVDPASGRGYTPIAQFGR